MKLLLDTHILIWFFDEDEKLSKKVRTLIRDTNNEIYFSALAIFEIKWKLKTRPDKIPSIAEKILELCLDSGFKCLSLELNHILAFENLKRKAGKPLHKDPFDNLMLAQAVAEDMTFITHDEHIAEYDSKNIFKV
jgi:PIN domain nuclease of toxin-antitoxin system